MPLSTSMQNLYSNKCLIRVWFVAISTYCSSTVPFSTNNVLHLQVMVIFPKQHFFFLCGLPVFSTEFTLQSCFCNHSCIQKFFFCKKDLLQQSNNQSFDTLYHCLEYEHVQSSKGKVKCKTFKITPVHNIFNSNRETRGQRIKFLLRTNFNQNFLTQFHEKLIKCFGHVTGMERIRALKKSANVKENTIANVCVT